MARVFFSSIPKCGKNLLYSLFLGIGFKRHFHHSEVYAEAAYATLFKQINYAYPYKEPSHNYSSILSLREELTSIPDQSVFHRHLLPLPEFRRILKDAGMRTLFIVRDPRDALVSAANYAIKQRKPVHIVQRMQSFEIRKVLLFLLRGDNGTAPFLEQFIAFHAWQSWEEVLTVRFEDLVGELGGGSSAMQYGALMRILDHVKVNPAVIHNAAESVFNRRVGTFFRGQIDSYREHFYGDVEDLFNHRFGFLLDSWGYR